jgi:hypothetical protein
MDTDTADDGGTYEAAGFSKHTISGVEYYRTFITFEARETTTRWQLYVRDGTTEVFAGDGTSGLRAWGAQLELGQLTDYIATEGAPVTRDPVTEVVITGQRPANPTFIKTLNAVAPVADVIALRYDQA